MFSNLSFLKAALLSLSFTLCSFATAQLTQVSVLIEPTSNDCGTNKYFDDPNGTLTGFSNCRIFVDNGGELAYLSDVIIKFGSGSENFDNSLVNNTAEISSNYTGNTQASEFALAFDDNTNSSGTWTYNNNVFKYPDIRFWTAKAGNDFLLFWMVDATEIPTNCTAGENGANLTYGCMSLAESVTTGTWTTPESRGLSHITFFGGLCSESDVNFDSNCGPGTEVPEPTSIALFALALLGITARHKRFFS